MSCSQWHCFQTALLTSLQIMANGIVVNISSPYSHIHFSKQNPQAHNISPPPTANCNYVNPFRCSNEFPLSMFRILFPCILKMLGTYFKGFLFPRTICANTKNSWFPILREYFILCPWFDLIFVGFRCCGIVDIYQNNLKHTSLYVSHGNRFWCFQYYAFVRCCWDCWIFP